jgi:hypothetical protein
MFTQTPALSRPVDPRPTVTGDQLMSFRTRMDPLADGVVHALATCPEPSGRRLLNLALEEGIDAVANAPEPLRKLFAQLDSVPPWVDWDELNLGGATTLRCGIFSVLALMCYALPLAYASPEGNKPLAQSGRLLKYAHRRILETGRFVLETCRSNGLQRWAGGFQSTVRVRIMHAQVRQSLLRSGTWATDLWGAPINQVDMAGTTLLLSVMVLDALRRMGAHFAAHEARAVIHLWRYSGYLLGVDEELLCSSEPEAWRLAQQACFSTKAPDGHSRALVSALFDTRFKVPVGGLHWPMGIYRGLARELVGEELADRLGLKQVWHGPLVLAGVRSLLTALEFTRRVVPGMDTLATGAGQRLWSQFLESAQC